MAIYPPHILKWEKSVIGSGDEWQEEADAVLKYKPCGTQFRPMKGDIAWTLANDYQGKSPVDVFCGKWGTRLY